MSCQMEKNEGGGSSLRLQVYYIKGCPGPHRLREFEFSPGTTHELVTTLRAGSFGEAFTHMQGENYWAPVEVMRETIRGLEGVRHTSMSVSDVLVNATDPARTAYVCVPFGWVTVQELRERAAHEQASALGLEVGWKKAMR